MYIHTYVHASTLFAFACMYVTCVYFHVYASTRMYDKALLCA